MNLKRIFTMQKELDEAIKNRNDLKQITNKEWETMWTLALLVETAEFANEVQSFKYWKAHKNINKEKILEEFADILHFLGSYAYKLNVNPEIEPLIVSEDINVQICSLFSTISAGINNLNKYNIGQMLAMSLGAAKMLGYTEKEITEWYEIKNKKNYERIQNKY
ncbi:dUTP diphosphatase [Mycoplasmopsis lipofaciens]|uniref:dUTP diphosphatase n=1 Tax=Mycoplasmopsis lipofaciens TaxID=114884 RepID=UPI0004807AF2|nr:dUTP diphosphatase [Mycoplasmopsis lipofaciens]